MIKWFITNFHNYIIQLVSIIILVIFFIFFMCLILYIIFFYKDEFKDKKI
jgi:hypothetical protein